MARHHEIPATPENMVYGFLDARQPPVLRIASGDTVTLHAVPSGGRESLPTNGLTVPDDFLAALDALAHHPGPHFLTGPVHVEGAEPGDVLQVDILEVKPRLDWGFVAILPLLGTLPEEFTDYEFIHPTIDAERGVCTMPWGVEIPLDPFFGVMAVAPPPAWGRCGSPVPRVFGGNMDNKELKPGTTLYLPVFNEGALFSAGDGHGVQGDGEVCITALETALSGTFRLTVRKDLGYRSPFAETADHLISIGLDEDLDDAAKQAVREMVAHVCARTNLTRNQAYMLCSLAGNLRVTQTVDGNKGVHMMLAKAVL
ncbi:acetamidase/formamidase family protein [Oharaeibacter diazotrophicus]|uniref:Acetamidase/formamidase n=1 Tax=Oharaeibacter diazotrophicus TaxID=1920512 RepID=A0A4R6R7H3_9HYPH|nr:acetamidase/formamidase family protein [Oharaeibacter diazotrophicus]TDP81930.1 acetamidase/formamidase [Oharaeibacter diazotrophicus]BBE73562.1 acetamidase/formamidase family protein [Pleomorphomonas sp. SM30]GLS75352.1 amidase [Oharaeibacter diazotrophicus]